VNGGPPVEPAGDRFGEEHWVGFEGEFVVGGRRPDREVGEGADFDVRQSAFI
jgi:hypothetical protein